MDENLAAPESSGSEPQLRLRRPDDWHAHLRDDETLALVAPFTARVFGRAIVMPNLTPPITTVAAARAYRDRIGAAVSSSARFTPLMTAFLTDAIDPDEVEAGYRDGVLAACKLYPAHATTNSAAGVTDVRRIHSVLERMQAVGMPLLVHGEVVDPDVDIFDREAVFLDRVLAPLATSFPDLKIVLEHITTSDAVDFVRAARPGRMAATITPHHLVINRNHLLVGGIKPHLYCLPVAKREHHRQAVRAAATSGEPCFFLGTDSAPHAVPAKESACGCAGIFSAPCALASYATTFEEEGALAHLEAFASLNGPGFYGLAPNEERITLVRRPQRIPDTVGHGPLRVAVFHGGSELPWQLAP